jgi:hypothetical protein
MQVPWRSCILLCVMQYSWLNALNQKIAHFYTLAVTKLHIKKKLVNQ